MNQNPLPEIQPNITPEQSEAQLPSPVQTQTNWSKVILFIILGLIAVTGIAYAGFYTGQKQISNKKPVNMQETEASDLVVTTTPAAKTNLTDNWKTYRNDNFGIIFSYPQNSDSPYEPSSQLTNHNKYMTIDFNTQCSGLNISKYQSNKFLEDYIRYDLIKSTNDNEWESYKNNYLQLDNNKIQIGGKETINVGPMGIGETDNFFVKADDSSIVLITASLSVPEGMDPKEWESNPCNINHDKEVEMINQILSSFNFL